MYFEIVAARQREILPSKTCVVTATEQKINKKRNGRPTLTNIPILWINAVPFKHYSNETLVKGIKIFRNIGIGEQRRAHDAISRF